MPDSKAMRAIADRVEIEALRAEFADAAMLADHDRVASLFTDDAVYRIPDADIEHIGRQAIREGAERLAGSWEYFVQTTHPGAVEFDGDTATGRAYICELGKARDGRSMLNYALFHDRYRRTAAGWRFTERVYEVRYFDTAPLTGRPDVVWEDEVPVPPFTEPASALSLERAATALKANNFVVEILDDVAAARARVAELIPDGTEVLTAASETLRLSGIDDDLNASGEYRAVRPRLLAMDRASEGDEIRRLAACPDVVVGSVAAVTETGSLVAASGSGSQLPSYAGGSRAIWIVGAQKIVPDLAAALRRVEEHALPLEDARARKVYGQPSAINRLLVLNAEPFPGRGTVLLLREAIGF
ncbi:Ketosteroid isomerase homolog [Prauserella marina]|uniref:Ketosteroid isomerase homolog n=1 Tax=Prauserella marina TaxID=530584 RepID=A0A1G6SBI7_9PSEU|nr:LUD domain-containing protein [Prauserella marina]PWV81869.1 ketosteroid isomerase-like protein [Prauserella marina]SDD14219.1 Ketosteroid isomerase homolog [Prauserella marina]